MMRLVAIAYDRVMKGVEDGGLARWRTDLLGDLRAPRMPKLPRRRGVAVGPARALRVPEGGALTRTVQARRK